MKSTTLRKLGILFIVLGLFLVTFGLIGLNTPINCPANGCPPGYSLAYFIEFYLGLSFIAVGIALLVGSRYARVER